MEIDKEIAELIVDTYRKINSFKKLLHENPAAGDNSLFENVNVLGKLMNKTLDENAERLIQKNLYRAVEVSSGMVKYYADHSRVSFRYNDKIACCLDEMSTDLNNLYSRFNGRAYNVQEISI